MEPLPISGHLGSGEPMVKPTWKRSVFVLLKIYLSGL